MRPTLSLPAPVCDTIGSLERAGFRAYAVGGCVRDLLLGRTPGDFDVTTDATPDQVLHLFDGRALPTGTRHGTVTVQAGEMPIEVTTFRVDGGYLDGRHPDAVQFTASLPDDLARRDFTVNAMAYHPTEGLCDPYGGMKDLNCRVLRCVGDPDVRFSEDYLRILRCVRFACTLSFAVEEKTFEAACAYAPGLARISRERIWSELSRVLACANLEPLFVFLSRVGEWVLPPIKAMRGCAQNSPHHIYDVLGHTFKAVRAAPVDPVVRMALLLHDSGKPSCKTTENGRDHFYGHVEASARIAKQTLLDLRCPRAFTDEVLALIAWHDADLEPTGSCMRRLLNRLGEQGARRLLTVKRCDESAKAPGGIPARLAHLDACEQMLAQVLAQKQAYTLSQLAVNGRDVMDACGVPAGPAVGRVLSRLLDAVIKGELPNEREALLGAAKSLADF